MTAVVDPSAFDVAYFNNLYKIHAEDFLKGIESNGLLIVDSDNRLRDNLLERVKLLPIKYRQQLLILLEELLLKKKSRRVVQCHLDSHHVPSTSDLLELAYQISNRSGGSEERFDTI